MVLIAIVLGVAFAWLIETGWISLLGKLKTDAKRQQWRTYRDRAGYVLVLLLFFMVAYVLVCGIYGRYTGDLASRSVRILYFIMLPDSLGPIIGFTIGAAIYWLRRKIKKIYDDVVGAMQSSRQDSRRARQPASPAKSRTAQPQDGGAKAAYSWLTGIVGIAAVTMLAIITLVIFFPEVLTRVESIKVAGIEARFATSASHSVRIQGESERTSSQYNYILNKWQSVEKTFDNLVGPVRLKFLEESKAIPGQFDKLNNEAITVESQARDFLKAFAVPLSKVMFCYSKDFGAVRYTAPQNKAASLANRWASFAILVVRENESNAGKPQALAIREQQWKQKFDQLRRELTEFIISVDEDLFERQSRCGLSSERAPYGRDKSDPAKIDTAARRDKDYFATKEYMKLVADMDKNLPAIFSNGYVIAFMADKIMFTQTPEQALEFLNAMAAHLDNKPTAITGQFNFYSSRANMRYRSDVWNFTDWIADVQATLKIALSITKKFTGKGFEKAECAKSADPLGRYYCALTARTINDLIYGHVREWLNGHRISPQALLETEEWAKQLQEWLREQSYAALLNNSPEISAEARVSVMAASYDTLALYELLVGTTKSELTKDRCGRGWALLNRSKNIWDALRDNNGDAYRGAVSIFHAHENLFTNACSS